MTKLSKFDEIQILYNLLSDNPGGEQGHPEFYIKVSGKWGGEECDGFIPIQTNLGSQPDEIVLGIESIKLDESKDLSRIDARYILHPFTPSPSRYELDPEAEGFTERVHELRMRWGGRDYHLKNLGIDLHTGEVIYLTWGINAN